MFISNISNLPGRLADVPCRSLPFLDVSPKEMMSALLSARDVRVMVCQGAEVSGEAAGWSWGNDSKKIVKVDVVI